MIKVCKIRIYPNKYQINLINETLGCCRYMKNLYIEYNQKIYKEEGRFISGYEFSKLTNQLKKSEDKFKWISNYSSKAIKEAIMSEEKAYKNFFKKKSGYPKFKSRRRIHKESFFFIKDNIKYTKDNYIIKLPILGKIRISEHNYLPELETITSGRIIREYNKYYVSFTYNYIPNKIHHNSYKMGIDVGIKNYGTIYLSTGDIFIIDHFKDDQKYKDIENKIKRLQEIISNKAEVNYYRKLNTYLDNHDGILPSDKYKNIMKGESYNTSNIRVLKRKVRKYYKKLNNIRNDFINKLVYTIVARTKPINITIEDLDISQMLKKDKNHTLHKYISMSGFYMFREKLINKCHEYNTEIRIADKYFTSSKTCSVCGYINKKLTLNDRIYNCPECGSKLDRDLNASINLCNLKKKYYSVI